MSDQTTLVCELREISRQFVAERHWQPFHSPKNLVMALAVEAAELMEHFLWVDADASRQLVNEPPHREAVGEEIADVFTVCLALCNALDLDLSDLYRKKMLKNAQKYPAERVRGLARLPEE